MSTEHLFDTRVTVKGENAEKVRTYLDAIMKKETRPTYSNAIVSVLVRCMELENKNADKINKDEKGT